MVLSQYILMSQEAGSNPPQETGLMTNSWYGKFHLEMRWHHQFHFLLWGRGHLAARADGFFDAVREPARDFTARMQVHPVPGASWFTLEVIVSLCVVLFMQGYDGVRWPKMVGPPHEMTWPDLPSRRRGDKPFFWYSYFSLLTPPGFHAMERLWRQHSNRHIRSGMTGHPTLGRGSSGSSRTRSPSPRWPTALPLNTPTQPKKAMQCSSGTTRPFTTLQ